MLAAFPDTARDLIELGCEHEAQHQELLLTDILHLFAQNPLAPAYRSTPFETLPVPDAVGWITGPTGIVEIGHSSAGFAFDCEGPCHKTYLAPHALADRLVTNAKWQAFISDGGYAQPELWLSEGWAWVQRDTITAPLYWRDDKVFGLGGLHPRNPAAPVTHISHYEADAYARWAGARLPTEFEWEASAAQLSDAFGHVWQWTGSAYQEKQVSSASGIALILAAVMVFLILAAQYEKWTLPLSVLLAMPFGIFGALLAVWLRGYTNDVYFQIGLVTLLGLAAKNAILIVEFAVMKHREGYPVAAAAIAAARLRFRPIVMTSLAFILGVLPLALSTGAGAGARTSAGTGVVGGMLAATFLAIFFVPLAFKILTARSMTTTPEELLPPPQSDEPGAAEERGHAH